MLKSDRFQCDEQFYTVTKEQTRALDIAVYNFMYHAMNSGYSYDKAVAAVFAEVTNSLAEFHFEGRLGKFEKEVPND